MTFFWQNPTASLLGNETFRDKRAELLAGLRDRGWLPSQRGLKVEHATSPDGAVRFWFKPQAIYYSVAGVPDMFGEVHERHDFKRAHSLSMDMRRDTVDGLVRQAEQIRRTG